MRTITEEAHMTKHTFLALIGIGLLILSPMVFAHILANFTALPNESFEPDSASLTHIYDLLLVSR